ncbi:MAG: hypothetical protein LBD34_04190 [Puniceicoccales bacterium]|jgi:hypothetical protein|nr:hypothetical protein [Puniceicoccales bacterium]
MTSKAFELSMNGNLAAIFFLLTGILFNLRRHIGSPKVAFINMWALRISFSLFLSFLINTCSEESKPIPLLMVTVLLVIFLIESMRLWKLTNIFAEIDIPLFPKFRQCTENFVWPIGKFFDQTRQLILAHKFNEKTLLKIGSDDCFVMYSLVFYGNNQHSRLQIIFDFLRNGCPMLNCILTSFTKDGKVIITNNLQTVFASFYPQSWDVKRCPMASLEKLLKIHASRIAKKKIIAINDEDSLETINGERHQIELENCNAGLCEKLQENDNITLTSMGRYRLWCDMLNYRYFGGSF